MWGVGLFFVALLVIYYTYWINKWRNPKCNGVLPPGSMGLPLIGETLHLLIPIYSLGPHSFIKKRVQRYGPIFQTSVAGRPIIVSADSEFNHYLINQEGRLVELWYLDTFSKLFVLDGESRMNATGLVHNYGRSFFLRQLGYESLKETLLPQIQDMFNKTLPTWSTQASVEVRRSVSAMLTDFTAKQMFGCDAEKLLSEEKLSDKFSGGFTRILMSFPLNIPGTSYHRCLEDRKKVINMLNKMIEDRRKSHRSSGDILDQAIGDIGKEKFLTQDFIVNLLFGFLFFPGESISAVIALLFKLLAEHPSVLQELTTEHEKILQNRKDPDCSLTWDEYKSMAFTHQVINETLRLGNTTPGLLRRAIKDIQYNGYTIPSGWTIMIVASACHINPDMYKDPLTFNPWRWKDLDSCNISKNFMPFGGGTRQCAGAEFSKVFLATFLHILLTKYRWTKIKGGNFARGPILGFQNGIHIKFCKKY